jgi:Uma2 family endonuclease
MGLAAHPVDYSIADYLAFERGASERHEYLHGQILAMAGGTPTHALLIGTVLGVLRAALQKGRCRVYPSDLRVTTPTGLRTYPDLTVVCGRTQRDRDDPDAVTNPTVLIEVLSKSTERYDRGVKFEHYSSIPSLRHYVLVAQSAREMEVRSRGQDDIWTSRVFHDGETAELPMLGATLDVRALYDEAQEPEA